MEEKLIYFQMRYEKAKRNWLRTGKIEFLHQYKFFELQRNLEREIYLHS